MGVPPHSRRACRSGHHGAAKTEAEIAVPLIGGTALLSPFLLRPLTRPFGRGTAGTLLRANILTGSGRAAAVIVPVLITVGLSASILGTRDTASAATSAAARQQSARADFMVLPAGTPGLTAALVDRVHSISGVAATAVTDTTVLAYEPQETALGLQSPIPIEFAAMGIDRPSAALNLKVTAGSLNGLNAQTIAVDSSWDKQVGDTMRLWRADGSAVSLKVVAVLAATLSGPSLVVDPHNAGAAMPDRVYVTAASPAARTALLAAARSSGARVVPVSGWSATVSNQDQQQNQVGLELLLGIAIAYSAIGIAGAFLISAGGRKPELTLLHKTGAIRRQIVWFVTAESLVLTLAGIILSALVAGLMLGSLDLALTNEAGAVPVVLPRALLGEILAACLAIAVVTSALPAWLQFRPRRLLRHP